MRPVKDISGVWNQQGKVRFKWDVSELGSDRCIFVVEIKVDPKSGAYGIGSRTMVDVCDLNTANDSVTMAIATRAGVYEMLFCAFSTQGEMVSDEEIIAACKNDAAFQVRVMMGRAVISYVVKTSVVKETKVVKIYIKSDRNIAQGVLGYKYRLDEGMIEFPFPGNISSGKTEFAPILIPKEAEVQIGAIDARFTGNLSLTKKKYRLFL